MPADLSRRAFLGVVGAVAATAAGVPALAAAPTDDFADFFRALLAQYSDRPAEQCWLVPADALDALCRPSWFNALKTVIKVPAATWAHPRADALAAGVPVTADEGWQAVRFTLLQTPCFVVDDRSGPDKAVCLATLVRDGLHDLQREVAHRRDLIGVGAPRWTITLVPGSAVELFCRVDGVLPA